MRAFAWLPLLFLVAAGDTSPVGTGIGRPPAARTAAAPTRSQAASVLGELQFVPNRGQWHDAVRFAALGDTTGWLHDDGFTVRFERWDEREPGGGATQRAQAGHVVRTRFLDADTPRFETGVELATRRSFLRGDRERWRSDVPAFAGVTMRGVQPGLDVAFRALTAGKRGPFAYDLLLAPGADLSRFAARVDGARSLRVDGDGRLRVQLADANGALATELVHEAPVAWQRTARGPRAVTVAFRLLDATTYGFAANELDAASAAVVDPSVVWSTYLGGGATDSVNALRWREGFGVWVAGWAGSSDFPTTTGAFRTAGGADGFVARLDDGGTQVLFATYLGGARGEEVRGLALGPGDTPTVVGFTQSADFPVTPGALQPVYGGGSPFLDVGDAFVTRLNANGTALLSSTYVGGAYDDAAEAVVVDGVGDALVAGWSSSSTFPTTPGVFQPAFVGIPGATTNGFVARVASSAQAFVFSTFVGGTSNDQFVSIDRDPVTGDVVAAGWTLGVDFPTTAGAVRPASGGLSDGIVTRLSPTGGAVFSTYLGGLDQDQALAVTFAGDGTVWVGGTTKSANFPVGANAPQTAVAGDTDGFVTQLTANGQALGASTLLGGTGPDRVRALDAGAAGVVAVGEAGPLFPVTPDAHQSAFAGGNFDGFFVLLTNGGATLAHATYFGGAAQDVLGSVVLGNGGLVMLGGWSFSSDFPVLAPLQPSRLGVEDGVVMQLDLVSSFGDGLAVTGEPAQAVERVPSGERELLRATLQNLTARELVIDAVRVLIAGAGDASARVVSVRAIRELGASAATVAGPVPVGGDDAEIALTLTGCTVPPSATVQLRLVGELAGDPAGAAAEVAAAIVGVDAWTLHATGAGTGPTVRVAAPGRAIGPVLLLGELPGDVDADGVRTVVDVRRQVLRSGAPAAGADCDGDGVLTATDLAATRDALLGRPTSFGVPAAVARGAWITLRGVFPELRSLQVTLGGRVLRQGCATPRELTVQVPSDQLFGTQEFVLSASGRVVVATLVAVQ